MAQLRLGDIVSTVLRHPLILTCGWWRWCFKCADVLWSPTYACV